MKRVKQFLLKEWLKAVAWYEEETGRRHLGFAAYLLSWAAVLAVLLSVPLVRAFGVIWGNLLAGPSGAVGLSLILAFFLFLEKAESRLWRKGF